MIALRSAVEEIASAVSGLRKALRDKSGITLHDSWEIENRINAAEKLIAVSYGELRGKEAEERR
jgi:hypothetical protein